MDEVLIARWNATVKDTDDVYILGDFIYKAKKPAIWYLKQLKGRKHLIQGNHDFHILKDENLMKEFVSTDKMMYVKDGNYTIVLCHFPIAEWNRYWRGSWHIYGHIHNQKKGCFDFMSNEYRALNAGCMINNYVPVTIGQLIENNRIYRENALYDRYGENKGPLLLENGTWILPTVRYDWNQNGEKVMEEGSIHYIMSEYCGTGVSYHYYINGKRSHEHSFSAVLDAVYRSKGMFEIMEADRHEYSEQELNFLNRLLEKMREG